VNSIFSNLIIIIPSSFIKQLYFLTPPFSFFFFSLLFSTIAALCFFSFSLNFLPYRRKKPVSTTALLELPTTQAMELLHSQSVDEALAPLSGNPLHGIDDNCKPFLTSVNGNLTFPSNKALIERATKLSVFSAGEHQWMA
jgi:hypothetical protein